MFSGTLIFHERLEKMAGGPPPRDWTKVRTVTRQVVAAWKNEGKIAKRRHASSKRKEERLTGVRALVGR